MRTSLLCRAQLVTALGAALITSPLPAQEYSDDLIVGVQSKLDRQKLIWDGIHAYKLKNAPEHGKNYAVLLIQPTKSLNKLVKPVNAADIRDELVIQLEKNGYHQVKPGQKPDILLWVVYGRSWVPNPYFTAKIDVDNMWPEEQPMAVGTGAIGRDADAPVQVAITDPNIAAELSIPRNSHAATMLRYEKLFILVRAFKYPPPPNPKKKPEAAWVAMMYVDDPAHRDLNLVFKQMLAAGAPYFDKELKRPDVEVRKIPAAHVNVGTPEVVEPTKPSGK